MLMGLSPTRGGGPFFMGASRKQLRAKEKGEPSVAYEKLTGSAKVVPFLAAIDSPVCQSAEGVRFDD